MQLLWTVKTLNRLYLVMFNSALHYTIISYKGLLGGEAFEGGSAEKQTIDLGKNSYFPEFEKNLLGKNKEDNIEFDMTFPKDYNNEKLNGKKVKFKIKL